MSVEVNGIITWLRTFFDDVYALKGQGGTITLDDVYPVGSIYMSISSTSPSILFGGNWVRIKDTFLLASGDTYSSDGDVATAQHGSATVTLTANQSGVPAHNHGMAHNHNHHHTAIAYQLAAGTGTARRIPLGYNSTSAEGTLTTSYDNTASSKSVTDNNSSADASEPHDNMPPYMSVYIWKRVSDDFDSILLTSTKNILSYSDNDSCTLSAQLIQNNSIAEVEDVSVVFSNGATVLGTAYTDNTGLATLTYSATGVGDMTITAYVEGGITSSEVYITDIYWYSNDGTKLTGTYTTGSDSTYSYITNINTNVEFPYVPTGDFELSMKAYRPSTVSGRGLLIEFGSSKSDTLLCGWDDGNSSSAKNCRIYRRSGNTNTSVTNNTSPNYNNEEWIDFKLRFEDGTVTLSIGETSISTSRSTVSRIGVYNTTTSRISELKIKAL